MLIYIFTEGFLNRGSMATSREFFYKIIICILKVYFTLSKAVLRPQELVNDNPMYKKRSYISYKKILKIKCFFPESQVKTKKRS